MAHICARKLGIIGSDSGLSHVLFHALSEPTLAYWENIPAKFESNENTTICIQEDEYDNIGSYSLYVSASMC